MGDYDSITTADDVLKLAAQRTGLTEIDSDSWRAGLELILDDVNSSPAFPVRPRTHPGPTATPTGPPARCATCGSCPRAWCCNPTPSTRMRWGATRWRRCSTTPSGRCDRFALNAYSLDQYGLTVGQLEPIFAEYLDTFDIELEGTP